MRYRLPICGHPVAGPYLHTQSSRDSVLDHGASQLRRSTTRRSSSRLPTSPQLPHKNPRCSASDPAVVKRVDSSHSPPTKSPQPPPVLPRCEPSVTNMGNRVDSSLSAARAALAALSVSERDALFADFRGSAATPSVTATPPPRASAPRASTSCTIASHPNFTTTPTPDTAAASSASGPSCSPPPRPKPTDIGTPVAAASVSLPDSFTAAFGSLTYGTGFR
ncbi:uncharacterized protein [Hetaerina americana]|uniref:uncharacterized protein n=1 Tax=Hetaerina americana TaxID=62018 RepID=UPI003A7F4042